MEPSKGGSLNKQDLAKQAKAAVVWSAAPILMYLTAVLGVIQLQGHHFVLKDLVPSDITIGGIVAWALMQVQGLIIRWSRGS